MMQSDKAVAHVEVHLTGPQDFERVVCRHQKQIYRVLLALLRDADVAETLTQECFLRAFRKRSSFRGESDLTTWLVAIAVNLARDHSKNRRWIFWRRLTRTDRIEAIPTPDAGRSPEQALIDHEACNAVWSSVKRLSERQKTVFLLRFVEEMPLESIARAMDLEIGTVKAHLFRAVDAVKNDCARRNGQRWTHQASREHRNAKRQGKKYFGRASIR